MQNARPDPELFEAKQNGGMTLAVGVTPSFDLKYIQGAGALGVWGSLNFNTLEFNSNFYYSHESGGAVKMPLPSVDLLSMEATVYTSFDHDTALNGYFDVYGAGYNNWDTTIVKPRGATFNGYQVTKSLWSKSPVNVKHDPSIYMRSGWGTTFGLLGN